MEISPLLEAGPGPLPGDQPEHEPGGEAQQIQDPKTERSPRPEKQLVPTWDHEIELRSRGYRLVAGVDEAGRGAWAGPLVAAAVVFEPEAFGEAACATGRYEELGRLRDSKLLSACVREELLDCVRMAALAVGVGVVTSGLIDAIGLGPANRLAMARAVRALAGSQGSTHALLPDFLLIDAFKLPTMPIPQRPIIKGDATCMSIAAASVVAKVTRDRMLCQFDLEYPGYGFAQHKGYGTQQHAEALQSLGLLPIHRRSFAPIKALLPEE